MDVMIELRNKIYHVTCILENIKELTKILAEGEVVLHVDFSRNKECLALGETQEYFFNKQTLSELLHIL